MSQIFSVLSGIQQPPALPARSDFPTCDALAVQPGSLAGSNQLLPGAEAPDFTQLEKSCLVFSTSISHSACIKMKAGGVHPHKSPLTPRSVPRSAHVGTKATSLSPQRHQDPALPGVFPRGGGWCPRGVLDAGGHSSTACLSGRQIHNRNIQAAGRLDLRATLRLTQSWSLSPADLFILGPRGSQPQSAAFSEKGTARPGVCF